MKRNKTLKAIKQLNDHIIVCGADLKSRTGSRVLVSIDEELIIHRQGEGHLAIIGDR